MIIAGYILLVLGVVASIVGEIMFLTVAFKRSLLWFFGCIFIPLVALIFFFRERELFSVDHEAAA